MTDETRPIDASDPPATMTERCRLLDLPVWHAEAGGAMSLVSGAAAGPGHQWLEALGRSIVSHLFDSAAIDDSVWAVTASDGYRFVVARDEADIADWLECEELAVEAAPLRMCRAIVDDDLIVLTDTEASGDALDAFRELL